MAGNLEVLRVLGDDYTRAGRWQEGLEVDLELVRLRPEDPEVHYNLACSHSLLGQLKEAARVLSRAIELGYRHFGHLKTDMDLTNLRKSPEFAPVASLIEKIKKP